MAMDDEQARARWADMQRQGPLRFVLLRGVLGWGVTTAVLYTLLMWWLADAQPLRLLAMALVVFPLGGVLWGGGIWWWLSRRFGTGTTGR